MLNHELLDDIPDHFLDFSSTQPKHKFNLSLSYTMNRWELDTDIHYVSHTNYNATVGDVTSPRRRSSTDAYIIFNARIGYRLFESTYISVDGFNLTDKHNERPAFSVANPRGAATAGGNEIGRSVLFTVRHKF